MKTDKQIFKIFAAEPQWLFELTDLKSPGECVLQAVALKAVEHGCDGLVVPNNPRQPLTVVEFQFQMDPQIYTRTVREMGDF